VKETLLTLVTEGRLHTKRKLDLVEPAALDHKNRGHYRACMELVDLVLTQEQMQVLQLKVSEQEKIDNFDNVLTITAYTIEHAAFEKMKELDGVTSSASCKTISGLGNRYAKYCKENNIQHKMGGNHPVAPPTGNSSIMNFFSAAAARVAKTPFHLDEMTAGRAHLDSIRYTDSYRNT